MPLDRLRYDSQSATSANAFPYLILIFFVAISLLNTWFSSYHNRTFHHLKAELDRERNQLMNEISELEIEVTELTAVTRIHQLASEMNMVPPADLPKLLYIDQR